MTTITADIITQVHPEVIVIVVGDILTGEIIIMALIETLIMVDDRQGQQWLVVG